MKIRRSARRNGACAAIFRCPLEFLVDKNQRLKDDELFTMCKHFMTWLDFNRSETTGFMRFYIVDLLKRYIVQVDLLYFSKLSSLAETHFHTAVRPDINTPVQNMLRSG